jgi:simple sugar transport system permease protein
LLPEQFIRMIPYVVTIVAIAGFVGRVRPPAAAGRAYEGGGGS